MRRVLDVSVAYKSSTAISFFDGLSPPVSLCAEAFRSLTSEGPVALRSFRSIICAVATSAIEERPYISTDHSQPILDNSRRAKLRYWCHRLRIIVDVQQNNVL